MLTLPVVNVCKFHRYYKKNKSKFVWTIILYMIRYSWRNVVLSLTRFIKTERKLYYYHNVYDNSPKIKHLSSSVVQMIVYNIGCVV